MFNLQGKDSDKYFKEVEDKLIEETNYLLELNQSQEVVKACKKIENLVFPEYYPEYSSERIITMDWMTGVHLSEFTAINTNIEIANTLGQALWDFYMYQIHILRKVHADPHPGNFLVNEQNKLIAIDFGCMKVIPNDFYIPYFELIDKKVLNNPKLFKEKLFELEIHLVILVVYFLTFITETFHNGKGITNYTGLFKTPTYFQTGRITLVYEEFATFFSVS
jgi:predicted unusual protein kinase regulating ubiquinone biosynthesis (AarF/ABC1/UbiB family)